MRNEDKRAARRARVLLGARLHSEAGSADAFIRDLSRDGALIASRAMVAPGARIVLTRADFAVPGRVAWAENGRMGLTFDWPVHEAALMVPAPPPPVPDQPHARPGFRATAELSDKDRETLEIWGGH